MIDIHTHLLPEVDDGVPTREEADRMLAQYREAGFSTIVCTPHLANPFVRTNILNIRKSFLWFQEVADQYGIEALLGSELFIGSKKSRFIPFLDRFLLVETSTIDCPLFMLERIFEYQLEGFEIILAHIERYSWFSLDSATAVRMREMGVHFQVNIEGLENGDARPYLEADWIDFIGSDNHGSGKRKSVNLELFRNYPEIIARSLKILDLQSG